MKSNRQCFALYVNALTGMIALLLHAAMAGPAYPLKLSPGQHYVVDQRGTPFFIQGDSPWYLTELLTGTDPEYYISNRWVQGYNSIMLDIVARPLDDLAPTDANAYGVYPFTNIVSGYTNLLSVNEAYFTNVDAVLATAGKYGICVFAYPLYDDYAGAGWYAQMVGNSTNALYQYGQFIGNRYKSVTNLVWIGAGDYTEPGTPMNNLWNWVAAGMSSIDTNHMFTAQAARLSPAITYTNFVNLNSSYPRFYTYPYSLLNYQHLPVIPSYMREDYDEHSPYMVEFGFSTVPTTALNCRQEAWWAVLSGDMGQFYADDWQWEFTDGWQSEMWDAGATTITNVVKLMMSRPWWNCVPDAAHTVVTSGYGTSGTIDYITCTREATGKTLLAYIPQDAMTPTVDMTKISGSMANAWWFDPRIGTTTQIGNFNCTGTQTFTPPDTNDWVLVLDDASQNYPPPGVGSAQGSAQKTNSLSIQSLGGSLFQLTVSGVPAQTYTLQYTTNLNVSWQSLASGTTDYTGTFYFDFVATWSASFYRFWH